MSLLFNKIFNTKNKECKMLNNSTKEFRNQFLYDIKITIESLKISLDFIKEYILAINDDLIKKEESQRFIEIKKDINNIVNAVRNESRKTKDINHMKELINHMIELIDDITEEFKGDYTLTERLSKYYNINRELYSLNDI